MGGRGSASGKSVKGKAYGTEYTTLYESGKRKSGRRREETRSAYRRFNGRW